MLPVLSETPKDQEGWDRFAFHNRVSHDAINTALQRIVGGHIEDPITFPVDAADWGGWLQRHSLLHQQMSAALGAKSSDLSMLDSKDPDQVAQWVQTHWLEHQTAESALGISS